MSDVVQLRGVSKRFGDFTALDGIDLTVSPGEIRGFLGPNGAGKTTAMRILVGLLQTDGGSVEVLGGDPWRDHRVRADLGFLPSDPGLYGRMRGTELLDHFAALSQREPVLRERACALLRMDASDLARPVRTYSKGMRQKIGVLQAVQHDPTLLILDEPGEGLDPLVLAGLVELLRDRRDAGRSILFSSHVLAEVAALCDRVTMIRNGRIIGEGTIAELSDQQARTVILQLVDAAAPVELPGCTLIDRTGSRVTLAHHGEVRPLLTALAALDLHDVRIEEVSLDEVFMDYYRDEATA
ncbi:MAG: ABC transporter ATP-binding protein [Actinobacteria bacterium]|nr:ABC transporter ATP-binding protein [Actinomycetota bacterium]